ncbi:hypothetical protein LAU42_06555 [Macrococcus armenti]|uniref:hypothetical protein n=1 Tax=Macrococcus armenti TaxID=2875764 RepID=UPI001CCEB188|nr:hypothetical protein [Macrococcus armenti]UBH21462.1 hypothetical protein LAU42_06555 [Macrococcus armenti]
MSVGTIIFIMIAVISGVSALLDKNKGNESSSNRKASDAKGVLSEFQQQLQQIEATINQGMNNDTEQKSEKPRGQTLGRIKPKKVVQQQSVTQHAKQNVKRAEEKVTRMKPSHNFTLAEQIYKIENDDNLTARQKQNRIQSLVMTQEIEVAADDLTFDKAAVVNGIIMSEVLGKPKSMQ